MLIDSSLKTRHHPARTKQIENQLIWRIYIMSFLLFGITLGKKPTSQPTEPDPWEGSSGTHVSVYKSEIQNIADFLSDDTRKVLTRFVREEKCAELYVEGDADGYGIIAKIHIHVSKGVPYEAVVNPVNLKKSEEMAFINKIPLSVEFKRDS